MKWHNPDKWTVVAVPHYRDFSGTSASAPHASGTAALLKSLNPELNHEDIEALIELGADDKGISSYDDEHGWGRLNTANALTFADAPYEVEHIEDNAINLPYQTELAGTFYNVIFDDLFVDHASLTSQTWDVKQYRVYASIHHHDFHQAIAAWPRHSEAYGWSDQIGGTGPVWTTPRQYMTNFNRITAFDNCKVTVETYVYELFEPGTLSGTPVARGWVPYPPQNVRFAVSILKDASAFSPVSDCYSNKSNETENTDSIIFYQQFQATLFPNPATDVLQISINKACENTTLIIYNPLGQKIHAQSLKFGNLPSQYSIDISHIPSGHYFIHLISGGQSRAEKLIILD